MSQQREGSHQHGLGVSQTRPERTEVRRPGTEDQRRPIAHRVTSDLYRELGLLASLDERQAYLLYYNTQVGNTSEAIPLGALAWRERERERREREAQRRQMLIEQSKARKSHHRGGSRYHKYRPGQDEDGQQTGRRHDSDERA